MISKIKIGYSSVVIACLALNASAESLNIEKYQQAEQQLSKHTEKLIFGTVENPSWTENTKLIYHSQTKHGKQFYLIDAKIKAKEQAETTTAKDEKSKTAFSKDVNPKQVQTMVDKVANRAWSKFGKPIPANVKQKAGVTRQSYIESAKTELQQIAKEFDPKKTDKDGNPIDFNNGNWTITLALNIHRHRPTINTRTFSDMLDLKQPDKKEVTKKEEPKKEEKKEEPPPRPKTLKDLDILTNLRFNN